MEHLRYATVPTRNDANLEPSHKDTCYLSDLFVDPNQRGTGAGRALIVAVEQVGAQAGATIVHWLTTSDNTQVRALYDQIAELMPFVQYTTPI